MADIQYARGDATDPVGEGPAVIAHVCNDIGGWGRGFVLALSKRWPEPEQAYRHWYREGGPGGLELGALQLVPVADGLWVANMIGQHGIRAAGGRPPVRYDAIESALAKVAEAAVAEGATVHMPRIGCGLAGGTWDEIEPLIQRTLTAAGIDVTVYDLP